MTVPLGGGVAIPIPKGLVYRAPPANLLAEATRVVDAFAITLQPGTNGALVGVATDVGINAAIVHRAGDRFAIVGWIGKDWGSKITGGGGGKVTW